MFYFCSFVRNQNVMLNVVLGLALGWFTVHGHWKWNQTSINQTLDGQEMPFFPGKCIMPGLLTAEKPNWSMEDSLAQALRWCHNDHSGVSNHQPHGCLLNRLFRRRSKKTSKLRVTGLCAGKSPGPVNSPHKGPVTRKMFPFDDVIMC